MSDRDVKEVLIVDDHPVVRRGLREMVNELSSLQTKAEAATVPDAIEQVERADFDLALVDISLNGESGLDFVKYCRRNKFDFPILVVSIHEPSLYAERALSVGAQGYVCKYVTQDKLEQAIKWVLDGKHVIGTEIIDADELGSELESDEGLVVVLSDREMEVFLQVGEGYAPRQIAENLSVSVKTVETHRKNIREKLNIEDASSLRRFAIEWRLENNVEAPGRGVSTS